MEPEETAAAPLLLRFRSGRTAALVIGGGIGGGMLLLGVATTAASAPSMTAVWNAVLGYGGAILPLLVAAALIAVCRSELWLVPEKKSIRLLTFRPWRRGPSVGRDGPARPGPGSEGVRRGAAQSGRADRHPGLP